METTGPLQDESVVVVMVDDVFKIKALQILKYEWWHESVIAKRV
jgi:hypothetical protein